MPPLIEDSSEEDVCKPVPLRKSRSCKKVAKVGAKKASKRVKKLGCKVSALAGQTQAQMRSVYFVIWGWFRCPSNWLFYKIHAGIVPL